MASQPGGDPASGTDGAGSSRPADVGSVAAPEVWAARAGVAERAVRSRHLRPLCWLPATSLGLAHWPVAFADHLHLPFNYWWQAHLLDCLVDAELRSPAADRRSMITRVLRGIRVRNLGGWTNRYYDDMAWLGLAIQRIDRVLGGSRASAISVIADQLRAAWTEDGGGIWWRKNDDYKNVPANGPMAIFLARQADQAGLARAVSTMDWIERLLVDRETGLVWDGVRVSPDGRVRAVERQVYSYCQGVLLGICVELAVATGDARWTDRAERTIDAVAERLTDGGVLRGHGGGDGGLFTGILVRYLADAALRLPAESPSGVRARRSAATLVIASAEGAWRNVAMVASGPLFGADWTVPAVEPSSSGVGRPERDFSVQLSGWMTTEAAANLERHTDPASAG